MSILNVIDNKYRDLWGMYDLQRNLKVSVNTEEFAYFLINEA